MLIKSSKLYDVLKYMQRIFLPALLTLVVTLGKVFGWNTESIAIVGGAIITFFGALMQIEYYVWNNNMNPESIEIPKQDEEEKDA